MMFGKNIKTYLLFMVTVAVLIVEVPIITVGKTAQPLPSDAIIILGAKLIGDQPSTMLRLRLEEAAKLYSQGYAAAIIVSGAKGSDEPISEAEAMLAYLVNKGIPQERIFIEDNSFNTYQNLSNSHKIMKKYGFSSAIIVSNASHIRRALVLANNLGIHATGAPAPMADNAYLTAKQYAREGAAMVSLFIINR